jgi:CheY-like chemotaxis protein
VRDGGEALAFVSRMGKIGGGPCPDVVILDLNLPKVDGPEILVDFESTCSARMRHSKDSPGER